MPLHAMMVYVSFCFTRVVGTSSQHDYANLLKVTSPNAKLRSGHSHSRNFDQYPHNTHQIEALRFLFPILNVHFKNSCL